MKRFLALFIAVVMLATLIPAGALTAAAAEGDSISMSYSELRSLGNARQGAVVTNWPENWRIDSTNALSGKLWDDFMGGDLYIWDTRDADKMKYTQLRFAVDITEDQAGFYVPSIAGIREKNGAVFSVFHVYNGKSTFLGSLTATSGTPTGHLNAVKLEAGTNTLAIVRRNAGNVEQNGWSVGFTKIELTKIAALPTVSAVNTTVPTEVMSIGETEALTATVAMSDGRDYNFNKETFGAADASRGADDTANQLEIVSSAPSVVKVNSVSKSGPETSTIINYELEAVGAGSADIIFTPYIDGVAQTPVVKTVKVSSSDAEGNITLSYTQLKELGNTLGEKPTVFPSYWNVDASGVTSTKDYTIYDESFRIGVYHWDTQDPSRTFRTQARFQINIDADQVGAYIPTVRTAILSSATFSVFHIYNGTSTYLGDITTTTDSFADKAVSGALNAVEFKEGVNTLAFVRRYTEIDKKDGYAVGFTEIKLNKIAALPTASAVNTTVPETIEKGADAALTATVAMSDGRNYNFNKATLIAETGRVGADDTANRLEVTSSNTNAVAVKSTSKGGPANSTTYNYELSAVGYGEADITFTPYINGVAQTPTVKKVSVAHPNAEITGNSVSIGLTAIVNGVASPEAKALLSESTVTAGNVNSVTVGTSVTLKAKDSETLKFLYWYNGNSGRMISDAATYTFTAGTNTPIYAKYADVNGDLTEYFSTAGQLIEKSESTFGTEPTKTIGNYYKLFKSTAAGAVYEAVEKISTLANFVCWTKDGEVVSYNDTYTYTPWTGNEDVTEVTTGEKSDIPAVVLFENDGTYMLELVNFEGVEIVEKGILFGGNLTISNCAEKAISVEDKNQFSASSDETTARAYVIYKDGTSYRVAYSK